MKSDPIRTSFQHFEKSLYRRNRCVVIFLFTTYKHFFQPAFLGETTFNFFSRKAFLYSREEDIYIWFMTVFFIFTQFVNRFESLYLARFIERSVFRRFSRLFLYFKIIVPLFWIFYIFVRIVNFAASVFSVYLIMAYFRLKRTRQTAS